jgi:hypothetical protein
MTAALVAGAITSAAFAAPTVDQAIRVGFNLDYTWITMDQLNKELGRGDEVTELNAGITGMVDLDWFVTHFLMVGVRGGYLQSLPASAHYNFVVYNQTTTYHAALIPFEAGLIGTFDSPDRPLLLMGGIYAGYGVALASFESDIRPLLGESSTLTQPYRGGGFVGELLGAVGLKLSPAVSLNINGGYRIAKITKMTQSEDVNYTGIAGLDIAAGSKGDLLKDSDNRNLALDFSGANIGVGFGLRF